MGKLAFMFPGQGAQTVGMGKEIYESHDAARKVWDETDDALGFSIRALCFDGPEADLRRTAMTQPAILACSVAAWRVVQVETGVAPDYALGHSLGEYSALVCAGALGLADAARAVHARGTFMQEAVPEGEGAMAAIMGLDAQKVVAICSEISDAQSRMIVEAANFNGPDQTVISGHAAGVERAIAALKEAGAKRALPLPVSAPFHCGLMYRVENRLRERLERIEVRELSCPVITNVEAAPNQERGRVVDLLVEQVTRPVRWTESVQRLVELGVDRTVELGPGRALTGMVKRIDRELRFANVEDTASLDKARAVLEG